LIAESLMIAIAAIRRYQNDVVGEQPAHSGQILCVEVVGPLSQGRRYRRPIGRQIMLRHSGFSASRQQRHAYDTTR
jgi:hypothetical protein